MSHSEVLDIIKHCYEGPIGDRNNANRIARKILDTGFLWPTIFENTQKHILTSDICKELEIFLDEIKSLRILFKFVRYFMFGGLISWGQSQPFVGTSLF